MWTMEFLYRLILWNKIIGNKHLFNMNRNIIFVIYNKIYKHKQY